MIKEVKGFSLVELLVCVAIISILSAMYLPALAKARRQAEAVVVMEGMRQDDIAARSGSGGNELIGFLPTDRDEYRAAFRTSPAGSYSAVWTTRLLCAIEGPDAFRAYWHTVINPAATEPLEFRYSSLVARDPEGNEYLLSPLGNWNGPAVPVAWEYLSTDLRETSQGSLVLNVQYSDGHVDRHRYPNEYPACPIVAKLSHEFVAASS